MHKDCENKKMNQSQQKILQDVAAFSMSLGLCKASFHENNRVISHMPVTFYPYLISAQTFNRLKQIHYVWQKLFVKIAMDSQFVSNLSAKFCQGDPFMQRTLAIYLANHQSGIGVACVRADYMGDQSPYLVQFNLMSVGLNGMSDRVQTLHSILNKYNSPIGKYTYPENKNQQTICKALITALQCANLKKGLVLMIVHEREFNYGDQHAFRLEMLKQGRTSESVTMEHLIQKMEFNEETRIASLDGSTIDAFYFRTGYALSHFSTEDHWKIREKIERSRSIKLPSIQMILINSKRMQSQIAKPEVLKRYLTQKETEAILSVSGEIHDFDDKSELQIQELIRKTGEKDYVLKPNREGGGNNFFSKEAHKKLKQLHSQKTQLRHHILMKKIKSTPIQNYFILDHTPVFIQKCTAQFSTFGCFVYEKGHMIMSQVGGTLVRWKREDVNQGGIAINQGAMSGVCVVNYQ